MRGFTLTLLVGALTGFFGAMPPGPLNVTIIRKASRHELRDAYRVALGGAIVDALICGAIGFGFSWLLERLVTDPWVKLGLAFFLILYGLKVLLVDRKRDAEAEATRGEERQPPLRAERSDRRLQLPIMVGLLQGAANPALLLNWTFVIGFLVGHRLIEPSPPAAAGFAGGVGLGVFAWFAVVIGILKNFHDHPISGWLRRSTVLAGALLVLFGVYFTFRSIGEI